MKKLLFVFLLFAIAFPVFAQSSKQDSLTTTLIFTRHAEKMEDGNSDPDLSLEGKARAVRLAEILISNYKVTAIYSTPFKRTRQTGQPLADSLGLQVLEYGFNDPRSLLERLILKNKGETILITGHSNSTPHLVNLVLGEQRFSQIDEAVYGDVFVVKASRIGDAKVETFTY